MTEPKVSFEDALAKLEKLTEEIERGEIGLEESIQRYEEGMKLVKLCRNMLTKAELRIQKLSSNDAGELSASPAKDLDVADADSDDLATGG